MITPERHTITVEVNAPSGDNIAETVDWLNRFFAFFHPSLQAVIRAKEYQKKPDPEIPGTDLLS